MNDKLKMSEVLKIMKDRVKFGRHVYYNDVTHCYCSLGALMQYHFPNKDMNLSTEWLLCEIYPELSNTEESYVRNTITELNDSSDSFDPVIAWLEEQDL